MQCNVPQASNHARGKRGCTANSVVRKTFLKGVQQCRIKCEVKRQYIYVCRHYIPIDYISVNDNPDEEQRINCPNRISQTAYLLQVRFSYNIWHTWNEGIMGVFQTLRELGKLPLAVVGDDGLLAEVHDGTGSSEDHCPWVFNHTLGKSQRQPSCIKENIPSNTFCDPVVDTWCEVGSTFSVHRNRGAQSPLILTFTPESTKNVWSHLYDSISLNQKTWSEVMGSCFDDLITGKTSTLNFYQTVNSTEPEQSVLAKIPRIDNLKARVDAMAVFKQFIMSSQREWVKLQRSQASTEPWNGYADVGMEKLRKGVSVEALHNGALNAVNPTSVPGAVQLEIDELRKTHEKYEQSTAPILNEFESLYGHSVPDHLSKSKAESLLDEESLAFRSTYSDGERLLKQKNRGGTNQLQTSHRQLQSQIDGTFHRSNIALEKPRPVVTYMSRNFFSRGIVNEKDILAYILSRYDVTLRVTTFQEPLLQVMELLSHTDVLLGMHGAGWTNALFMKRGAVAMQMFPYGWRLPNNSTVRGYNYREIVYASEGKYFEWVNPVRENAYFRRIDFNKGKTVQYQMHPRSVDHLPQDSWPGNQWIYQNTFVNMTVFKKEIDMLMAAAGIMPNL